MARPRLSLADLPPDVLLKIAGGCEEIEDILALRACCRSARAALDAWAWRQLTIARFGAAAAGDAGDDLEAEMCHYAGLESPLLVGLEPVGESTADKYHDFLDNGSWDGSDDDGRPFGLVSRVWTYHLETDFEAVWPGRYALEACATGEVPEVPFSVNLSWKGKDKRERRTFVDRKLTLQLDPHPPDREHTWLWGEADRPFTLHHRRSQRPRRVTCLISAREDDSDYDWGDGEYLEFCALRLRRLRSRQQA